MESQVVEMSQTSQTGQVRQERANSNMMLLLGESVRRVAVFVGLAVLSSCATWRGAVEHSDSSGQRQCDSQSQFEIQAKPQRPLIFVPGILGSKLMHTASGKPAWGGGFDVFFPRDRGYELVLPIRDAALEGGFGGSGSAGYGLATDLTPTTVVDEVRLVVYRRKVYGRLADYFESRGFQLGSLQNPQPNDSFFMFAYDYRRSNLETVRRLRAALDHLRRVRGGGHLEFDLLCQSNGGYVCRYLVRYGAEFDPRFASSNIPDLVPDPVVRDRAPSGLASNNRAAGPPQGLVPRRMALAGTANAGALRILREFRDGRYFVKTMGRLFSPELLFTVRPLFDDLPWHATANDGISNVFIDERGEPMKVDLHSAEEWKRYNLSVFSPAVEKRLQPSRVLGLFGSESDRMSYLEQRLHASQQFQNQLRARDVLEQDVQLFMIQGRDEMTLRRAVLAKAEGGWQTIFAGDRAARTLSQAVQEMLVEQGDGHATVSSQEMLSPSERRWLVGETVLASGSHFELVLDPLALGALGDFFLSETPSSWGQQ